KKGASPQPARPEPSHPPVQSPKPAPVSRTPLPPEEWNSCGNSGIGTEDRAINACGKIIEDAGRTLADHAMAASLMAEAYYSKTRYSTEIEMSNTAIKLNDQLSLPYYVRGMANFQLDKYQDAISDYNKAIERYSKPTNTNYQKQPSLGIYYNDR